MAYEWRMSCACFIKFELREEHKKDRINYLVEDGHYLTEFPSRGTLNLWNHENEELMIIWLTRRTKIA